MPKQHLTNDTWFMIQYAFVILVFLLLLWFLSRFIIRMGRNKQQGKNVQVIEVVRVGQDSFVYIVRVVDKYYVISQNKHALLHLDTLDEVEKKPAEADFSSFLGKMREKYASRKTSHQSTEIPEDFPYFPELDDAEEAHREDSCFDDDETEKHTDSAQ